MGNKSCDFENGGCRSRGTVHGLLCELEEGTISQPLAESIIYRLELSAQFVEQLLPFVNESKLELNEVFTNLKILFYSFCRKLEEIEGVKSAPNCTHLAVYSIDKPVSVLRQGYYARTTQI